MELEVSGLKLPLDAGLPNHDHLIKDAAAKALAVKPNAIKSLQLLRRSVDARKCAVHFVATVAVGLDPALGNPIDAVRPVKSVTVKPYKPYEPLKIPRLSLPEKTLHPVVVGTGPAGLFCALYLAKAGFAPLVIERGKPVDERRAAVDDFARGGPLDLSSNIQFGEGGAGTFSDGKLTTGIKGPYPRHVLQWFVDAGAPEEILWLAKPHMGTDNLQTIVKNLRQAIEAAGGVVLFSTRLTDFALNDEGHLQSVTVSATEKSLGRLKEALGDGVLNDEKGEATFPCESLVLACGHSARDTFRLVQRKGLALEPKAFSVGVRVEHPQSLINQAQYGKDASHPALGAADYKMVVHLPNGRSVYTFCMCPGGVVVPAASEEFGVVVNGMSTFARDGENANAALLVSVTPEDFPGNNPLAGVAFQRSLEQAAFGEARDLGGAPWQAPAQTVGDFLGDEAGNPSKTVKPSYGRGVVWCDLREVFPAYITDALAQALPLLDRKLHGFATGDAVMTAVESRSSSPVRILRNDETLQAFIPAPSKRVRPRDIARGHGSKTSTAPLHENLGIYPCGEGAGYAGGIMSAAADGLRVAEAIVAAAQKSNEESPKGATHGV